MYVWEKSDYAFAMFLATVVPSQFSTYEWKLFQAARLISPVRWRLGLTEKEN